MKPHLKRVFSLATVALFTTSAAIAEVDVRSSTIKTTLTAIPAPEIPDKAASLVAQSKAAEQEATAVSVVQAAIELAPAATPEIVGAIARKAPATAPAVAAAAVAQQPKMAAAIARAAAVSAPGYAGKIVAAMCKKLPSAYSAVALEVARVAPKAGPSILAGLLDAVPNLKPFIDRATIMAGRGSSTAQLVPILSYATALVQKAASSAGISSDQVLAQGITPAQEAQLTADSSQFNPLASTNQGVRFVPGGGKPGETNRSHVQVVEKGKGRDKSYSGP